MIEDPPSGFAAQVPLDSAGRRNSRPDGNIAAQTRHDYGLRSSVEQGTTTFHMIGTCRMGPEHDASAVVDHELRIRGVQGLRVADASIMPTMPAANTNAAALMIGEKAADLIRMNLAET